MQETEPLFTVAIPTYNRSKTLEKILIELSQEKDIPFKILVSDDQSSDDTETMVRKYQETSPNLFYNKNPVNLGFSGNVSKLYELADTRYVWFLCDDETVLPGAIKKIHEALKKYEPVVAVFNYSWEDSYGRISRAVAERDIVYDDPALLKDYQPLMRITFLSIVVMEKRKTMISIPREVYQDNVYFQLSLSLLLLSEKFRFCEMGALVVHRNVGYKYGDFFKFYLVDPLKSVYAANHTFDNRKFIQWMKGELPTALQVYLSQKLGLFNYAQEPTPDTKLKISQFFGIHKYFIFSFKYIKMLMPAILLKTFYMIKLISIHGYRRGVDIYKKNINRAYTDSRKTGFINYK